MFLDVDSCIQTLRSGECVSENELRQLCQLVSELLMEESNVQPVVSPVTIVGDLHGQFFDLLNLLQVGGWPPHTAYVFLGDFVDRGHNSVETLSLLLCLKLKYPGHVTLLRGNHEVIHSFHAWECLGLVRMFFVFVFGILLLPHLFGTWHFGCSFSPLCLDCLSLTIGLATKSYVYTVATNYAGLWLL